MLCLTKCSSHVVTTLLRERRYRTSRVPVNAGVEAQPWKSGHPNQCLRLGDNAKTDRTLRAGFRESASDGASFNKANRIKRPAFLLHSYFLL